MSKIKKKSMYAAAALAILMSANTSVTTLAAEGAIIDNEVITNESTLNSDAILDLRLESENIHVGDLIRVDIVMDNITNIAAEDFTVKYDSNKLERDGHYRITEGLIPAAMKKSEGAIRYVIASKGEANVINGTKTLLRMYFIAKEAGTTEVSIVNAKVSDGISMERQLTEKECGKILINVLDKE